MSNEPKSCSPRWPNAPLDDAFNALQPVMQDDINVHRFVFAHRTRGLADLLGKDYAYTILRQCVRFCCDHEQNRIDRKRAESPIRTLMPKLLDQYKLAAPKLGTRDPGDAAVEALARTIYQGPPERSAEAAAAALAEGISPEVVGEAISLASNMLVLKQGPDNWRTHGDSSGVHSSDATNAFRNMARVCSAAACGQRPGRRRLSRRHSHAVQDATPIRPPGTAATIKTTDPASLLDEAEDAIRNNNQGRAAAAIAIYGEKGHSPRRRLRSDAQIHDQRRRPPARREVFPDRAGRIPHDPARLPLAATRRPGPRHRQRLRLRPRRQIRPPRPGYEEACRLLKVTA